MKTIASISTLVLISLLFIGLNSTTVSAQNQGKTQGTSVKRIPVAPKSSPTTNNNTKKSTKRTTNNNSTTNNNNSKSTNQQKFNNLSLGKGKVFLGGGVNVSTDGKSSIIDAYPYVGYRVTPKATIGAGPVYQRYQSSNNERNILGLRSFARYDILSGVFANAEFEVLNYRFQNTATDATNGYTIARLPVGGGANKNFNGINANFSVMYDMLYHVSKNKTGYPYASPFLFRGSVNLGNFNLGG